MSDNIATLGLAIDSTQAVAATKALQNLQAAAAPTAASVAGLTAATAPAAAALANMSAATKNASAAHAGLDANAQAAFHSIRSMTEGILAGVPPTTMLAQQFGHLSFAAAGPSGLSGAFGDALGALTKLINPTTLLIGGLAGIGIAGALATVSLVKFETGLADLGDRTNTSISDLHALQQAASFKGIDTADFTKAMEQFGTLTAEAKYNVGTLSEQFHASGISAGTLTENLSKAADLIKAQANDQQRYLMLQSLGLPQTAQWLNLMKGGADAIKAATDATVQFGTEAETNLVLKARAAEDSWNHFTTSLSNNLRSALLSGLNLLQQFQDKLGSLAPPADILKLTLNAGGGTQLNQTDANKFYDSTKFDKQSGGGGGGGNTQTTAQIKAEIAQRQQLVGVLGAQATIDQQVQEKQDALTLAGIAGVNVTKTQAASILEYTRNQALGINAIRQQTDDQRIAATTIDMSVGAAAAYTAVQQRVNEALIRGAPLRKDQIADLEKEAKALGAAAQGAAELRLKSDTAFATSQLGRTDADQQAASALKNLYGEDYVNHLNDAIADQIRFNVVLSDTKSTAQSALSGFFNDLVQGKSAADALRGSLQTIEKKLIDMATNALISNLFKSLIGGAGGGGAGGGLLSGLFGSKHTGGTIDGSGPTRNVSPLLFMNAPRFHDGGLVQDEIPIIARKGERVLTPEQWNAFRGGAQGGNGGGNNVVVNVHNNAPNTTTETRKSSQGGIDTHEIIVKSVNDAMSSGRFDAPMRARYNSQVQPRSR